MVWKCSVFGLVSIFGFCFVLVWFGFLSFCLCFGLCFGLGLGIGFGFGFGLFFFYFFNLVLVLVFVLILALVQFYIVVPQDGWGGVGGWV